MRRAQRRVTSTAAATELVLVFKRRHTFTPTPSSRVSTAAGGPTSGTMRRSAVCRRPKVLPCIAHGGRRRSWPMRFWTCPASGAVVLDPFAGTGTTIIAAEKTGRQGRAIERDPLYCDLIIRRWQQYTGKAARLAGSHQTFADVEAVRLLGQSTSTAKRSGGQWHVRKIRSHRRRADGNSGRRIAEQTSRRVPGWPRFSAPRQAVEERRAIAKSPRAAAEGPDDASGPQEGIGTGHQQKGRRFPAAIKQF